MKKLFMIALIVTIVASCSKPREYFTQSEMDSLVNVGTASVWGNYDVSTKLYQGVTIDGEIYAPLIDTIAQDKDYILVRIKE